MTSSSSALAWNHGWASGRSSAYSSSLPTRSTCNSSARVTFSAARGLNKTNKDRSTLGRISESGALQAVIQQVKGTGCFFFVCLFVFVFLVIRRRSWSSTTGKATGWLTAQAKTFLLAWTSCGASGRADYPTKISTGCWATDGPLCPRHRQLGTIAGSSWTSKALQQQQQKKKLPLKLDITIIMLSFSLWSSSLSMSSSLFHVIETSWCYLLSSSHLFIKYKLWIKKKRKKFAVIVIRYQCWPLSSTAPLSLPQKHLCSTAPQIRMHINYFEICVVFILIY